MPIFIRSKKNCCGYTQRHKPVERQQGVSLDSQKTLQRIWAQSKTGLQKAISLSQKLKQLSFAKDHEHWGVEDWKKVLFTDETKVNLVGSDGKMYIRRFKNERFNSQFIKGQLQAGNGSILAGVPSDMMALVQLCK